MRKFAGIIESTIAPPVNCLWLNKGELKAHINGKWISITSSTNNADPGNDNSEDKIVIIDMSEEQTTAYLGNQPVTIENNNLIGGVGTIMLRLSDGTFQIMNNILGFDNNFAYRGDISDLEAFNENTTYTNRIVYVEGFLNVTSGTFTFKIIDTDIPSDIIGLEIGNSATVKSHNLYLLNKYNLPYFFTQLDYGYGVGTFNSSNGGFIHIINAYGNDIFYTIDIDGSISKKEDYIKPNEPYSVQLEASQIGVVLDNITANKVYNCGELIVTGSTGAITYTRCSDSTGTSVSFTDITKQGRISILTYNNTTRTISSSTTSAFMQHATTAAYGIVKKAEHVPTISTNTATIDNCANTLNNLINALVSAGIMDSN